MSKESSKTRAIFTQDEWRYLTGSGIDIGCGDDPILDTCDRFDMLDGDANYICRYVHKSYNWVYSSHCLEHMIDPVSALREWGRLLLPGGYLIATFPDEDLYEQGVWPSRFNADHLHTFTISKRKSWSPVSVNVLDMVKQIKGFDTIKIELHDFGYDRSLIGVDQTLGNAMAQIMIILRKHDYGRDSFVLPYASNLSITVCS